MSSYKIKVIIPIRESESPSTTLDSIKQYTTNTIDTLVVVDTDKKGACWARNKGWDMIKDEDFDFVMFCDNDTEWRGGALDILANTLMAHPEAGYSYCSFSIGEHEFGKRDFTIESLFQGNYITTSASLIRKECFTRFDENVQRLQDWDLWLDMYFKNGTTGVWCGRTLFNTKMREGGISHNGSIGLGVATEIIKKKWGLARVQVVLPAINLWNDYTLPCIKSLNIAIENAKRHGISTRVLFIDNGSQDETCKEASKMVTGNFAHKRNEKAWSFSKSVNFGVEDAWTRNFDYAFVINNDILLHKDAIIYLVKRFRQADPEIAMLSCLDVQGEMGDGREINFINAKEREYISESEHPNFSAFMISKYAWEKIGQFDENFSPAYHEDNDLHYRICQIGMKALCIPPAMFYHYGSRTWNNAILESATVKQQMFLATRAYYVTKWGGLPGEEKFTHPYNDKNLSVKDWLHNDNI